MKNTQITFMIFGLAILASGCSTMSAPELKVQNADTYEQHQEKEGLVIGVHVMTDKMEVEKTFKINLLNKQILPILVVVENRNSSANFMVAKEKVYVLDEATGKADTSPRKDVTAGKAAAGNTMQALGGVTGVFGAKLASDATVIEYGIADKQFSSSTLESGGKTHGFLYFQLPRAPSDNSNKYQIVAHVKNTSTGAVIPFYFDVNPPLK